MRVGQKTQRTRVWAKRGTRPRQTVDLRTEFLNSGSEMKARRPDDPVPDIPKRKRASR